jgi:hypothetical protein
MKVGVLATMVFATLIGFPIASFAGLAPDDDTDGIPNVLDKCSLDPRNASGTATCDTDTDGYGNACDGDFDQNYAVVGSDFGSFFVPAFKGLSGATRGQDMDCNGSTIATDFGSYFVPKFKGLIGGTAVGPSGLSCAGTPGCS